MIRQNGTTMESSTSASKVVAIDDQIADVIITRPGAERIDTEQLVNEGGGIAVDGAGTVLLMETVQRDPRRNPVSRAPGSKPIWHARWAPISRSGCIVAFIATPTHLARSATSICWLRLWLLTASSSATANGAAWQVERLPAPRQLRDNHDFVDYSYINHLPNGAVIAGTFDDPADNEAKVILADLYPGRRIVGVEARPIFARGGGIHCITQQQPRV